MKNFSISFMTISVLLFFAGCSAKKDFQDVPINAQNDVSFSQNGKVETNLNSLRVLEGVNNKGTSVYSTDGNAIYYDSKKLNLAANKIALFPFDGGLIPLQEEKGVGPKTNLITDGKNSFLDGVELDFGDRGNFYKFTEKFKYPNVFSRRLGENGVDIEYVDSNISKKKSDEFNGLFKSYIEDYKSCAANHPLLHRIVANTSNVFNILLYNGYEEEVNILLESHKNQLKSSCFDSEKKILKPKVIADIDATKGSKKNNQTNISQGNILEWMPIVESKGDDAEIQYFIKNGVVRHLGRLQKEIPLADVDSFVFLGHYGMDKNQVYYRGEALTGVIPSNLFVELGVYTRIGDVILHNNKILSNDGDNFHLFLDDYAKDTEHIFVGSQKINVEDVSSIQLLLHNNPQTRGISFWKDSRFVYYFNQSKGSSLKKLKGKLKEYACGHANNQDNSRHNDTSNCNPGDGILERYVDVYADPHTFEILDYSHNKIYVKDEKIVFYNLKQLWSDAKSFRALGGYGSDERYVYYNGHRFNTYDGNTFEFLGAGYFKDKEGIYFGELPDGVRVIGKNKNFDIFEDESGAPYLNFPKDPIPGVDKNTFEIIESINNNGRSVYARDMSGVYYQGNKLYLNVNSISLFPFDLGFFAIKNFNIQGDTGYQPNNNLITDGNKAYLAGKEFDFNDGGNYFKRTEGFKYQNVFNKRFGEHGINLDYIKSELTEREVEWFRALLDVYIRRYGKCTKYNIQQFESFKKSMLGYFDILVYNGIKKDIDLRFQKQKENILIQCGVS